MKEYDVVIVGGGLVGSSLAVLLARLNLSIALIESHPIKMQETAHYDDRVIALSYGSKAIFEQMNVWQEFQASATPIHHIHVSQKKAFGTVQLDRQDLKATALGYVAPARSIGQAVQKALSFYSEGLTIYSPATVTSVNATTADAVEISVEEQTGQPLLDLRCGLLVAADGANSKVREAMGWSVTETDYHQHAIICNVSLSEPHHNIAYERFAVEGPVAMLPLQAQNMACVWTVDQNHVDDLLALPDDQFIEALQQHFGYRIGLIQKVGARSSFPLKQTKVSTFSDSRVVLIGNAAHSMHPVAGQGFNLGLRDAHALNQLLQDAQSGSLTICDDRLAAFQQAREKDHQWVMGATHSLIKLFALPGMPSQWLRAMGMMGLDAAPGVKQALTRYAMGTH